MVAIVAAAVVRKVFDAARFTQDAVDPEILVAVVQQEIVTEFRSGDTRWQ